MPSGTDGDFAMRSTDRMLYVTITLVSALSVTSHLAKWYAKGDLTAFGWLITASFSIQLIYSVRKLVRG